MNARNIPGGVFIPIEDVPECLLPIVDPVDVEIIRRELFLRMFKIARLRRAEWEVLRVRFGLDGSERMTLAACAASRGITATRVGSIEARALNKLRAAAVRLSRPSPWPYNYYGYPYRAEVGL